MSPHLPWAIRAARSPIMLRVCCEIQGRLGFGRLEPKQPTATFVTVSLSDCHLASTPSCSD
eukprot:11303176-Alexandrium_andersonii.AAC.1